MTSFELTKDIAATPERVWSVLADYARDGEWRAGVEMRQEPPGLATTGAITYERIRLFGTHKRVVARIEDVEPGHRLAFRTLESDVPVRGERRVDPHGDGTRVTLRMEMTPTGVWRLVKRPLVAMFRRRCARDLDRLAALVRSDGES